MKRSAVFERIKTLYSRFVSVVKPIRRYPRTRSPTDKARNFAIKEPQSLAYQLIGVRIQSVLPLFKGLDTNLQKSGLRVGFKAYVSLIVLTAFLAAAGILVLTSATLLWVCGLPSMPSLLFGIGASMFAFAFSVIGFYAYPLYRADKRRRELEDELPFTTGYMAILSSAGVSPEKIFSSLASLNVPLAASAEAKNVVRDVNLFGLDVISALTEASKRAPSERFHEMLEGFISTVHSGSSLAVFLRQKSMQYMKLKKMNLAKFADTLSMLSEFYVVILVTGPLLLVIMLAVMAMLGGGGLGILSPDLLLSILTYVGIPLGSIMFLIILDSSSPKW